MLKWTFRKLDLGVWTGTSRLRIGKGDWRLGMRLLTFGFHKILGNSIWRSNIYIFYYAKLTLKKCPRISYFHAPTPIAGVLQVPLL